MVPRAAPAPRRCRRSPGAPRVEAGGRLVEQQHARAAEQRLGQAEALAHALGIGADAPPRRVGPGRRARAGRRRFGLGSPFSRAKKRRISRPVSAGLKATFSGRQPSRARRPSDAAAGSSPSTRSMPARRPDQAEHQLHQRGLAGAVVADQRHASRPAAG